MPTGASPSGRIGRYPTRSAAALGLALAALGVGFGSLIGATAAPAPEGMAASPVPQPAVIDPAVVDPALRAALHAESTRPISVLLLLRPAASRPAPASPGETVDASGRDPEPARAARRASRVAAWKEGHAGAAPGLRRLIEAERRAGRVTRADDLWLADAIAVTADPGAIAAFTRHPDVRRAVIEPVLVLPPEQSTGVDDDVANARDTTRSQPHRDTPHTDPRLDTTPSPQPPLWNIRAIRADAVWQRLGIDGSGVTVAVIDTGVDYHHPELQTRYRGHVDGAPPRNEESWWCSRDDAFCGIGAQYPVDGYGHGTHVAGTILAGDGIGVAPGARWVAARACSGRNCPSSWIIAALQWLLDLKPDRQPDIVNFSLGTDNAFDTALFLPVFNRLYDAGLVVVAASGNNAGILQAPASFTSTIGVGAVTDSGGVWPDSARGYSLWREPKPDLVAPGTGITSTVPGGGRLRNTGTSMATPHVSGVVALLLQVRPDLTPAGVKNILTRTARLAAATRPDPATGWGVVDAYAAVASVADVGMLRGRVVHAAGGNPIAWARVVVADEVGNPLSEVAVDPADGRYAVDLQPGAYLVIARAFGFDAQSRRVTVVVGVETGLDFRLAFAEPMGTFGGRLWDAATGSPLAGEIQLAGVPFAIVSDPVLGFSQRLPPQTYDLRIAKFGYRVKTDSIKIQPAETITAEYRLQPAPKVLLIDGDAWAYSGAIDHFRASLDRLGYVYHVHRVTNERAGPGKPGGPPLATDMAGYDVVIWSSALSSPNAVMGAWELLAFLDNGGRLFLSGQDALCYDAGRDVGALPCAAHVPPHPYVRQKLGLRVVSDRSGSSTVVGSADGPLAGITLTLNGPGSMDNQIAPDVYAVADPLRGRLIATYGDGQGAGALVGSCVPFRAVVLGFGFEGISGAAMRDRVMQRMIDSLVAAPAASGLYVAPDGARLSRPAGATADYTLTLTNTGIGPDTLAVEVAGARWPTEIWEAGLARPLAEPVAVNPCTPRPVVVRVRVPPGTPRGAADTARIRIRSLQSANTREVVLVTRTPAPVLVVDGDYNRQSEARYLAALDAGGVPYDTWELGLFNLNPTVPTTATLAGYPVVVWFNGYDILRPNGSLGIEGQRRLAVYLQGGGRLLLSAQDFLRHWGRTPYRGDRLFAADFLGVADFQDDAGAAAAGPMQGAGGSILAGLADCRLPPLPPGDDFSDQLVPGPDRLAAGALLNIYGQPVAVQNEAVSGFKSLFLALDAGGLDASCADALMLRTLDWFNPLFASTLQIVDAAGQPEIRRAFAGGETLRLRLHVSNTGPRAVDDARAQWTLPPGGSVVTASLPAGWQWDPQTGVLAWQGSLARFGSVEATVAFTIAPDLGAALDMASQARLTGEGITIVRRAGWRVNAADLGASSKSVPDDQRERTFGAPVKFIVNVVNLGTQPSAAFRLTDTLPVGLALIPGSLTPEGGQTTVDGRGRIVWAGPALLPGRAVSLAYIARVVTWRGGWLSNRAVLTDDSGATFVLSARIFARPFVAFPWLGWQMDLDP